MPVLKNIGLLACCRNEGSQADVQPIKNAALAWEGDNIAWAGSQSELPDNFKAAETHDAGGRLVIPGLIDCHTHLAFGGWRDDEFERRILGVSYLEIAQSGGGIASTVTNTRATSDDELFDRCIGFLGEMAKLGIATIEAKSGYGLSLKDELRLLRIYKKLNESQPLTIIPTLLAAHTVPAEFKDRRSKYIDLIIEEIIPQVAAEKLARFCDIFVEQSAFTIAEARRILQAAKDNGLQPKLHADQLTDGNGAALAAEVDAISADHLEHVSYRGMQLLAAAEVVAVALPMAVMVTGQKPFDARKFIDTGVKVAVATDFNPGTAPTYHLPLVMMLACLMNRMTPCEALKGATIYAAQALKCDKETGSIEKGKWADFSVIDSPSVDHWLYHFRPNACVMSVKSGKIRQ